MGLTTGKPTARSVYNNGNGGNDHERKRLTYAQDWPNYKLAREYEKEFFQLLLSDLMDQVCEPDYTFGRPRHRLSDVLKAMAIKVRGRMSTQRTKSDIRDAYRLGYLERVPGSNTIIDYFNLPELTPILSECIEFTASVLRPYETDFAVDSSGFRTTNYMRWLEEKHGKKGKLDADDEDERLVERKSREWLKVHMVVGTNTQTVTGVSVLGWRSSDYKQFIPLFERVTKLFDVQRITGDGAYAGYDNFNAAKKWRATAYTPFHHLHVRPADSDQSAWARAYRMYYDQFDEWFPLYHRRSLVETAYSTIKRLFGETIRSKKHVAQVNELLLKVLCHNIIVLIHEIFEMDIHPFFASADSRVLRSLPEEVLPLFLRDGIGPRHQWPVDSRHFKYISRMEPHPYPKGMSDGRVFQWPHHMPQSDW